MSNQLMAMSRLDDVDIKGACAWRRLGDTPHEICTSFLVYDVERREGIRRQGCQGGLRV